MLTESQNLQEGQINKVIMFKLIFKDCCAPERFTKHYLKETSL